jgi:hypothetical protein
MNKQLDLSLPELDAIGFTGIYLPADDNEPARTYYSIPVTNGEFVYNKSGEFRHSEDNAPYKWYLKTTVGDAVNYIWLDIGRVEELYIVLSCFRVKYNLVIF